MRAVWYVSDRFAIFAIAAWSIAAMERVGEAVLAGAAYPETRSRLMSQFFANYVDHGFVRRGLVGTLLRPVTGVVDAPQYLVFWIMVALNLAALAGILWCVARFLQPVGPGRDGIALLRAALAVGSLGVVQVAHDLGRFDMLNLALLVLALSFVLRQRLVSAGLVGTVAVLIHEGFAVYGAPLLLASGWHVLAPKVGAMRAVRGILIPLCMMTAASFAVMYWGNSDAAASMDHGNGGYVWDRGLVEFNRTLSGLQIAVLTAYMLATLSVLCWFYRGARFDLMLIAGLCPLALNFLGIDHARWLTLVFFVLLILAGLRLRLGLPLNAPARLSRIGLCLLCLPLGPMGVVAPLSWWM